MSVQRSQASIARGHKATYVVRVSTQNTSVADVSVTVTAHPTSQKATFTSGCTKGDGTASCTIGSVSANKPVVLHAQIAVPSSATSVKSVMLTAAASIVTTQKWKAPTVTETTAVTAASAPKPSPASTLPNILPLGPIPNLNGVASTLIQAGNATGPFPLVTPSPVPSPAASAHPPPPRSVGPAADSRALSPGRPILPAVVSGLVVLVLAVLLAITRLSQRMRSGS